MKFDVGGLKRGFGPGLMTQPDKKHDSTALNITLRSFRVALAFECQILSPAQQQSARTVAWING
jgi:hypothetical protein